MGKYATKQTQSHLDHILLRQIKITSNIDII